MTLAQARRRVWIQCLVGRRHSAPRGHAAVSQGRQVSDGGRPSLTRIHTPVVSHQQRLSRALASAKNLYL
jgi:hypothetical protein